MEEMMKMPPGPTLSSFGLVPFVGVDQMIRLVLARGVECVLVELADEIDDAFRAWPRFGKTSRPGGQGVDAVVELIPAADQSRSAFSYVGGHPGGGANGRRAVPAFGVLADAVTGHPLLISEMNILTVLRTAAMSALAARYLASREASSMAIIGNGAQAEFQALAFRVLLGIERLRLFDIDPAAMEKCRRNLASFGLDLTLCASAAEAVAGVDIITTATAGQRPAPILTAGMVGAGAHINAVGGDGPGKAEVHPDLLRRGEIFVEHEPQTRREGDIQQLAADHPVTEFWRVVSGRRPGRRSPEQITIFDSVGFAIEDFAALRYVRERLLDGAPVATFETSADPEEPRDLFGMLMRAA